MATTSEVAVGIILGEFCHSWEFERLGPSKREGQKPKRTDRESDENQVAISLPGGRKPFRAGLVLPTRMIVLPYFKFIASGRAGQCSERLAPRVKVGFRIPEFFAFFFYPDSEGNLKAAFGFYFPEASFQEEDLKRNPPSLNEFPMKKSRGWRLARDCPNIYCNPTQIGVISRRSIGANQRPSGRRGKKQQASIEVLGSECSWICRKIQAILRRTSSANFRHGYTGRAVATAWWRCPLRIILKRAAGEFGQFG
jgi:hypothetical protein